MNPTALSELEGCFRQLSPEQQRLVLEFVSYLAARQRASESFQTMLASEPSLRRDWDHPEEDAAWQGL